MSFVFDPLSSGRRFRVLNMVDDYSRKLIGQFVSVSITGYQVARFLSQLGEERGLTQSIVCDNKSGRRALFCRDFDGNAIELIEAQVHP